MRSLHDRRWFTDRGDDSLSLPQDDVAVTICIVKGRSHAWSQYAYSSWLEKRDNTETEAHAGSLLLAREA